MISPFPPRDLNRLRRLKAALRPAETSTMTPPEVVDFCEAALPGCTFEEIIAALREVAEEHLAEANLLERLMGGRERH